MTLTRFLRPTLRSGLGAATVGLPLVLAALLALGSADFRDAQNLGNFSGQIAALLIAALGQLLVTLIGGIDLSVGSVISLASAIVTTQADPAIGLLLALLMGGVVGLVNGAGITLAGVHPLVMTLGSATFLQGLAHAVLPIPGGRVSKELGSLASGSVMSLPLSLLWCLLAMAAVAWLLRRTRLGLHLYAVGALPRSAWLNGVPAPAVSLFAYAACSLMAVLAGIYLTARVGAGDPALGSAFALESVAAVALGGVQLTGGVGSVAGVVAGALSLGLLTNGLNLFGVSPFLRGVLTGALLLLAVSLQRRQTVGM